MIKGYSHDSFQLCFLYTLYQLLLTSDSLYVDIVLGVFFKSQLVLALVSHIFKIAFEI